MYFESVMPVDFYKDEVARMDIEYILLCAGMLLALSIIVTVLWRIWT